MLGRALLKVLLDQPGELTNQFVRPVSGSARTSVCNKVPRSLRLRDR